MDFADLIIQLQFLSAKELAEDLDEDSEIPYYEYLSGFFANAGQLPGVDSVHYNQIKANKLKQYGYLTFYLNYNIFRDLYY